MSATNTIKQIKKRDGRIVEFDIERITIAAKKALQVTGATNGKLPQTISKDVLAELVNAGYDQIDNVPDIETVQDLVERSFIKRGLTKAAKAYILYRAQHDNLRKNKQMMMDVQGLVADYLDREDWRVNENSNAGFSYASLLNHVSGSVVAHYRDCRSPFQRRYASP
jgi:ribonucleoside-triphosphate reductase